MLTVNSLIRIPVQHGFIRSSRHARSQDDGAKVKALLPDISNEALNQNLNQNSNGLDDGAGDSVSEALKRKDQITRERGVSRRRVRGGAPIGGNARGIVRTEKKDPMVDESEMRDEATSIADL